MLQRLFDLPATVPATVPAPNPLTPCTHCRRAWGTLPCPADWGTRCEPFTLLMIPMENGGVMCARCAFETITKPAVGEWLDGTLWHYAQWGYWYANVAADSPESLLVDSVVGRQAGRWQ